MRATGFLGNSPASGLLQWRSAASDLLQERLCFSLVVVSELGDEHRTIAHFINETYSNLIMSEYGELGYAKTKIAVKSENANSTENGSISFLLL